MSAALLAGLVFALVMPAGLPYDEPSHWATVQYIAHNWRLPVLGEPGVTYEAQQAPLYYVMAAPLSLLPNGFLAVRLLGVVGHALVTWLIWRLIGRVLPDAPAAALLGAAFIGLNPMLLAIAGSVQNDTWALLFGVWALQAALTCDASPTVAAGLWTGLLGGAAVITKLSMVPLVLGIAGWLLLRRRVIAPVSMIAATAVVTGWWFVRNLMLYGDLTGQSAVSRTGATFEHTELGLRYVVQSTLAYLTLPTEYVRNTVAAPSVIDAASLAIGLVILLGAVALAMRRSRTDGPAILLVGGVGLLSVGAWLLQVLFGQPVAFRTAYGVLPLVALCVGSLATLTRGKAAFLAATAILCTLQLAIMTWFLLAVAGQAPMLSP